MPVTYALLLEKRRVDGAASGVLTLEDLRAAQLLLVSESLFDPAFDQVFDLSKVTDFKLPDSYIQGAATSIFAPQSRLALVAPSDLAFGLARMFAAWNRKPEQINVRVFRGRDEALRWLSEPKD